MFRFDIENPHSILVKSIPKSLIKNISLIISMLLQSFYRNFESP